MIYLFISVSAILLCFIIVNNKQRKIQSNTSECSICHQIFPESDIFEADELPFCSEHISTYKNSNWVQYKEAISTPTESVDGINLYETKLKLWRDHKLPSVIKSTYEIKDVDQIVTKLTLYIRQADQVKVGL